MAAASPPLLEVDDDVLVDNAAAASMISPNMWVQRTAPRTDARLLEAQMAEEQQQQQARAPACEQLAVLSQEPSAPLPCDPELAYLQLEEEDPEREYLQQDREHLAALEELYAKMQEQSLALEERLQTVASASAEVTEENRSMRHIIAMMQVRREDFIINQHQPLVMQQRAIGERLLANLAPPQQPQQQHQQQQAPQQQQQQQQQALRQQQQQEQHDWQRPSGGGTYASQQQQEEEEEEWHGAPEASPRLLADHAGARTMSPKIAAFRSEQQYGGVVPTSPYDFPADSQTAAAALTLKQGDATAALLTLLDTALEDRGDRQARRAALTQSLGLQPLQP